MKSLFFAAFLLLFAVSAHSQKAVVVLYDPCGIGANQGIALKSKYQSYQIQFRGAEAFRKVRTGEFQIELNLAEGFIMVDDCGDQVLDGSELYLQPEQSICFEIKQS